MLQPGIPMTEYVTAADDWSTKPLLCDLLPQYRYSLQVRSLSKLSIQNGGDVMRYQKAEILASKQRCKSI